jgi:hypothetical protein
MYKLPHKQLAEERVVIVNRDEYDRIKSMIDEEENKRFKPKKCRHASFTILFGQYLMSVGRNAIAAQSKARLYDANLNLVKEFTSYYTLDTVNEGANQWIRVRIVDNSTDTYSFKYLYVLFQYDTTIAYAIIHTFSQTYTKGSDQIADITVRTGISGCVSG